LAFAAKAQVSHWLANFFWWPITISQREDLEEQNLEEKINTGGKSYKNWNPPPQKKREQFCK